MDTLRQVVKSDCDELLRRFRETGSIRFEVFSKIWREMKFSQIYYGTVRHKRREFSRLILDTAYVFLLPPFRFEIRVGGLYLLYSLFRCQTASPPEQIRLSLKDWEDVKTFEKDALDAKHFDIVYIFQHLIFLKAFLFTAMPTLLTFQKRKNKRKMEKSLLYEEFMERASRPQELINIERLEELSNVHSVYEKLKTSASLTSGDAASSLNLIHKDLASKLQTTVVDFHKWQQKKNTTCEEDDSGEGTSSQQEDCSRRAEQLALIKSKAYGEAAEASKSRRHRQVEVNVTSNEAGPSEPPGDSRTIKESLRSRTKKNIHISGDLGKEATLIRHLTTVALTPKEVTKKKEKV